MAYSPGMANKRTPVRRQINPAGRTKAKGPNHDKRVTPKGTESGRYTPPTPRTEKVSPIWVPILMFSLLGLGMLMIILNYVNVLPKSPHNGWLLGGLGCITAGFITATKYH
jgi:hypothetical protein